MFLSKDERELLEAYRSAKKFCVRFGPKSTEGMLARVIRYSEELRTVSSARLEELTKEMSELTMEIQKKSQLLDPSNDSTKVKKGKNEKQPIEITLPKLRAEYAEITEKLNLREKEKLLNAIGEVRSRLGLDMSGVSRQSIDELNDHMKYIELELNSRVKQSEAYKHECTKMRKYLGVEAEDLPKNYDKLDEQSLREFGKYVENVAALEKLRKARIFELNKKLTNFCSLLKCDNPDVVSRSATDGSDGTVIELEAKLQEKITEVYSLYANKITVLYNTVGLHMSQRRRYNQEVPTEEGVQELGHKVAILKEMARNPTHKPIVECLFKFQILFDTEKDIEKVHSTANSSSEVKSSEVKHLEIWLARSTPVIMAQLLHFLEQLRSNKTSFYCNNGRDDLLDMLKDKDLQSRIQIVKTNVFKQPLPMIASSPTAKPELPVSLITSGPIVKRGFETAITTKNRRHSTCGVFKQPEKTLNARRYSGRRFATHRHSIVPHPSICFKAL